MQVRDTSVSDKNHLFVFGLGYSARFLCRELAENGWTISGTCQSEEKRAELEAEGIQAYLFDRQRPLENFSDVLATVTHLLSSVPPDKDGDPVIDEHGDDLMHAAHLEWIGYLSTTGVYGDTGGRLVDESATLHPTSERSRRRVAAEAEWWALLEERGLPVHLFRLSGIYGPGYSTLDRVRDGTAKRVVRKGHVFSRIHVADIAQVLRASMTAPHPGAAYNLCDDEPAPPADLTTFACDLLGVEPPPEQDYDEVSKTMSKMALSFWQDNRRVDNTRIKEDLGVTLKYPNYREGLRAIFEGEG